MSVYLLFAWAIGLLQKGILGSTNLASVEGTVFPFSILLR